MSGLHQAAWPIRIRSIRRVEPEWIERTMADALGVAVSEVILGRNAHGRPEIVRPATDLRFSISHSGGTTLVALGSGADVGVDVERLNRPILQWALWPHVLTAAEMSRLPLAPAARRASLLALWVGKEAILKAAGVGLAVDPRHIELDESRRLVSLPHSFGSPADWSLSYLDHICGCVGAVACRSPGIELEIEHRSGSKSRRSRVG